MDEPEAISEEGGRVEVRARRKVLPVAAISRMERRLTRGTHLVPGLPLPLALFPPPSITSAPASMPRSPLWVAVFLLTEVS
jgi:hypothetical protein